MFSLILIFLSISCSPDELKGIVIDGITKKPLDNVSVTLVGTQILGVTNSEREFNIVDQPIGEHKIKLSRIHYNTLEFQISSKYEELVGTKNYYSLESELSQNQNNFLAFWSDFKDAVLKKQKNAYQYLLLVPLQYLQLHPVWSF